MASARFLGLTMDLEFDVDLYQAQREAGVARFRKRYLMVIRLYKKISENKS